jgi:RimJ/RimL family protein N-acetyltransferase
MLLTHDQISIQTQRLRLRALQEKDAETLYTYRNQPNVMLFQGWTPKDIKEVSDYAIEMQSRNPAAPGYWYQVVIEQYNQLTGEVGPVIGDVAFCIEKEMEKQAELGIALDTQYQGAGYAQEAVKGLINFLFETFDLHRIHLSIDPDNKASRKLTERVGFRFEAHLKSAVYFKGQWCDDIIMAMLNSEWQRL